MSTYRYEVLLPEGKTKAGRRTAKTKEGLRQRLAKELSVIKWILLEEVPQKEIAVSDTSKTPKSSTKLKKLLYLQAGRCFFCGQSLSLENASIEHLNPKSKGGTNKEDNLVVCHRSLNSIFGNMDLKRKFEFTLKTAGSLKCPED
jgi:5-methylcytosine-specific restriction endonuclease McrA